MREASPAYWPYPFLQNAEARNSLWQRQLTRSRMTGAILVGDAHAAGKFIPLAWDTQFFNQAIYKLVYLTGESPALDTTRRELEARAISQGMRYGVSFVPAEEQATASCLEEGGWKRIENRVSYVHRDLRAFVPRKRFAVRLATPSDTMVLTHVAVDAINPLDRFRADDHFDAATIDRFFAEWIRASVNDGFADAVLVPDVTLPRAFMTLNYLKDEWSITRTAISRIVLIAVDPAVTGWFPKLLSEALIRFRDQGAQMAVITTQRGNQAVCRALERYGFEQSDQTIVLRKVFS